VILLSGLGFAFEPEDALSPAERRWLAAFEPPSKSAAAGTPILTFELQSHRGLGAAPDPAMPASLGWEGGRVVLRHAAFESSIDPQAGRAWVRRDPETALALITTLRTALSARLPLEGGLVFHAAGLERGGKGLVCFGPSGIGKSTLAARSPWPVLSDELVAVLPRRGGEAHRISGTAFRRPPQGSLASFTPEPPLAALVELAQGPEFRLERLEPRAAVRRILGSITVPPGPPLWAAALAVVGDLVAAVPCYRMAWSLDGDPFAPLAAGLEI